MDDRLLEKSTLMGCGTLMDDRALLVSQDVNYGSEVQGNMRRRLGRGLNALLGGGPGSDSPGAAEPVASHSDLVHVDLIERNPYQPRRDFDRAAMDELVESIRVHGVLQPVLVRSHEGRYQLIAGERRWLAARQAGLDCVPCRVLELADQNLCEAALEENLKRKDLNPLEKAQAFQDYLNRFQSTIEIAAARFSMQRPTLSNYLRLLELPEAVKESLVAGKISAGHAKAILGLEKEEDRVAICQRIEKESLSVRKVEEIIRESQDTGTPDTIPMTAAVEGAAPKHPELTNHVLSLQDQLQQELGVKVEIKLSGKEAGRIVIRFNSNDEFENILRTLRRAA